MRRSLTIACALLTGATLAAPAANAVTVFATQVDAGRAAVAGPGFEATSAAKNTDRDDAANALGAPDQIGDAEGGFYSLGNGAAAVFGFGVSFGGQASVFEVTFGCNGPQNQNGSCNFNESADVYVLSGAYTPFDGAFGLAELLGAGFQFAGSIANGDANTAAGATLAIGGPFTVLALVDTSQQSGDGFDVDAVGVAPVPAPAAGLLLGSLLLGLGGMARARRRAA